MTNVCRIMNATVIIVLGASVAPDALWDEAQIPGLRGGITLGKAVVLTDGQVIDMASRACALTDQTTTIAQPGSPQAERLARLTHDLQNEDGLSLNFKVYIVEQVNAWAMPNGCVRLYSGLLDAFTDDEVLGVIGHEIGHVKLGHSKAKMRTALLARGARESAAGTTVGVYTAGELGDLAENVVNAQFSQKEERAADDYGFDFLVKHSYDPAAMVGMFLKLPSKKGGFLASHPDPESRAKRIEARLKQKR